jgi:DNA-directed RNA polymerase subunit RPC12/RpoP
MKALAKTPEDRYASMKEFAADLAETLKSTPEEAASEKPASLPAAAPAATPVTRPRKPVVQAATDTDVGLKRTAPAFEVSCLCGQRLIAKREMAGKRVKCPRCGDIVPLPGAEATKTSASHIVVACQQCQQRFLASGDLAGKAVRCPVCARALTVPKPGEIVPSLPQIEVRCVCGQHFVARPYLAGKRVRCTACGRPLDIPAARS